MRIDLRYPIVIGVFYLPGLLMLIGAWLLGYSTEEAREVIAVMGGFLGFVSAFLAAFLLHVGSDPIWWCIKMKGE